MTRQNSLVAHHLLWHHHDDVCGGLRPGEAPVNLLGQSPGIVVTALDHQQVDIAVGPISPRAAGPNRMICSGFATPTIRWTMSSSTALGIAPVRRLIVPRRMAGAPWGHPVKAASPPPAPHTGR